MATFAGSFATGDMSFQVTGLTALKLILSRSQRESTLLMAEALYAEANVIFNESQRVTPVATGVLRGTGFVNAPVITNTGAEVVMGYGGPSTPYAIFVHERVFTSKGRRVRHDPPTSAKFLEGPVLNAELTLGNRMARRMAGKLWGGA